MWLSSNQTKKRKLYKNNRISLANLYIDRSIDLSLSLARKLLQWSNFAACNWEFCEFRGAEAACPQLFISHTCIGSSSYVQEPRDSTAVEQIMSVYLMQFIHRIIHFKFEKQINYQTLREPRCWLSTSHGVLLNQLLHKSQSQKIILFSQTKIYIHSDVFKGKILEKILNLLYGY